METVGGGSKQGRSGRVGQQRGAEGRESGQRVERSRAGGEGGREGRKEAEAEVKGWKNVGILQQSGWCEGGRVRNVAGNARASSVCKKPHYNISHP